MNGFRQKISVNTDQLSRDMLINVDGFLDGF